MIIPKHFSVLLLLALFVCIISCEKEAVIEPIKAELLFNLDEDGNKEYYITGCDTIQIDSVKGEGYTYLTLSGCGNTFQDSVYIPNWYYNCYPVYDYNGNYLYDDCYWEYY